MNKYFKNVSRHTVQYFFYNEEKDKLDGFFSETKTDETLLFRKHNLRNLEYIHATSNPKAIELVENSIEISYDRYKLAYLVLQAMIDEEEFLIDEDAKYISENKQKEVVLDPIYAD